MHALDIKGFRVRAGGRVIAGVLHLQAAPAPVVIACHGLFSSRESEKFLRIAAAFSGEGFAVARFDFSGCGESTGDIADTTVSRRLRELEAVLQFTAGHPGVSGPCGIVGSSLGGYVGLLCAARRPVAALSVWATPCELLSLRDRIATEDLQKLKESFFIDARQYRLADVLRSLQNVQVIHGEEDEVVPPGHAERIHRALPEPKELVLLPGADHSISQEPQRQSAITQSLAWFKRHLR